MQVDVARPTTEPTEPTGSSGERGADAPSADAGDPSIRVESIGEGVGPRAVADAVRARLRDAGILVDQEAGWLVAAATTPQGRVDQQLLDRLVARRLEGEPLQVVVGETGFRFVTVGCRSGVFVPRPETEVVAGVAIAAAVAWPVADRRVVDLCTGTGAIALALASEVPGVDVVAVERDPAAADLARANATRLAGRTAPAPWRPGDHVAPGAHVAVLDGNLFEPLPAAWRGRVTVLVANPPYLPSSDRGTWAAEVAQHDPVAALVGGDDGHEVVDAILAGAGDWLAPGGTVVVELDERRDEDAVAVAGANGLVDATLVADLAGRPRAVVARRPTTGAPHPADNDNSSTGAAS